MEEKNLMDLLFMADMEVIIEACKTFVDTLDENNISLLMKQSAWCMLCDMLFKEDSVRIAEESAKHIKEVNESLGSL